MAKSIHKNYGFQKSWKRPKELWKIQQVTRTIRSTFARDREIYEPLCTV